MAKKAIPIPWTDEELEILHKNWEERASVLLELLPDRSRSSIMHKISRLGYQRNKQILTQENYDYIAENISTKTQKEIARELDVSPPVITRALKELGISKSNHWTQTAIDNEVEDSPFSIRIIYEKTVEYGGDANASNEK
ncbi:MarR family transcriptional regulator [Mammaliicoccus sp. P-M59]|uniref:MarR family transcriptional regulator n=1 Tax=Mammaliicoccus sp. P-M59 TaxID=2898718 RepID=UPI001EFA2E5A|nr:MarR family transcriptional regulator [Mammaliicoccus sp. P-M59]